MENRRVSPQSTMTPNKFGEVKTPSRSSKLHSLQLLPNTTSNSNKLCTPQSIRNRNGTFSTFPIVHTPTPPSSFRRIINPFEAGLTERLHLPLIGLIGSPSLFHRAATPPMSSTQNEFEWTIDEVSLLHPANVEAHETQFQTVVDPEYEAKAQAAISSFFSEQKVVPSPDDCPLRDNKVLPNFNRSFSECFTVQTRAKRDNWCQTELTLPPILPKAIEDALRPYFTFTQSQQCTPSKDCDRSVAADCAHNESIDHEARNASLRRKLFQSSTAKFVNDSSPSDYERDVLLDSPTPQTPELNMRNIRSQRFLTPQGRLNDENRESFGYISPISKETTPNRSAQLSTDKTIESELRKSASSLYRSTPERSSMFRSMSSSSISTSIDSAIQQRATRSNGSDLKRKSFHLNDDRRADFNKARASSESNESGDCSYDDDTHISQSSYGSQQHPHTPTLNKSKRRRLSVNPKNLSLSFNVTEENMSVIEHTSAMTLNMRETTAALGDVDGIKVNKTDSGFNETDDLGRPKQYRETGNVDRNGDVDVSMTADL